MQKHWMPFVVIIAVAITGTGLAHAISTYEIDNDYWFENSHTIKTSDGWTFHIKELKKYNLTGKVVGLKYYREDHLPFSPVDFCIAWGKVIEPPHNKWSNFTMLYRGCNPTYQSMDSGIELSSEYIDKHVANSHIIPSSKKIYDKLMNIKEGDFVEIGGTLVDVTGEREGGKIPPWTSDTKGTFKKCEIILVENIEVRELPEEYRENSNFLDEIRYNDEDGKRDFVFITMIGVMAVILVMFVLKTV